MKTTSSVKASRRGLNKFAGGSAQVDFERILEWARLYTAYLAGAVACAEEHGQVLLAKGETKERLHDLGGWRHSTLFSEREKAAFALCESISRKESPNFFTAALQKARRCFSTADLVRLALAIVAVNDWIYQSATGNPFP